MDPLKLNNAWHRFIPEDQEEEITTAAIAGRPFLKILIKRLKDELSKLDKEMTNNENFNKAAWPYLQASLVGKKESLQKVLDILSKIAYNKV